MRIIDRDAFYGILVRVMCEKVVWEWITNNWEFQKYFKFNLGLFLLFKD